MEFEVRTYDVEIEGLAPGLLLNNAQKADPDNEYAQQIQDLKTRAKSSTEAARQRSKVEYLGGLYLTDELTEEDDYRVVLPQAMLSRVLYGGAVKLDMKRGKTWSNGITVISPSLLNYDGPTNPDELSESSKFVLKVPVKQGAVTIVRTRPYFRKWTTTFRVELETDFIELDTFSRIIAIAGRQIGCGDWRPERGKGGKYGRFKVNQITAAS